MSRHFGTWNVKLLTVFGILGLKKAINRWISSLGNRWRGQGEVHEHDCSRLSQWQKSTVQDKPRKTAREKNNSLYSASAQSSKESI